MNDLKGHTCDCGLPATKRKGNAFVCDRCDRIEKQMYGTRNRRVMHDPVEANATKAPIDAVFAH